MIYLVAFTFNILVSSNPCEIVGHLSPEWLARQKARQAEIDRRNRQLPLVRRSVAEDGFADIAGGRKAGLLHSDAYTFQLQMGQPTDQSKSGRCWIFAGCNMLRSMGMNARILPPDIELSETYLYFFSMLEKSNSFLNKVVSSILEKVQKGETQTLSSPAFIRELREVDVTDGGLWTWFAYLVRKYGVVPKSVMPDTHSSLNSEILNTELQNILMYHMKKLIELAEKKDRTHLASELQKALNEGQEDLWTVLSTHLGTPPSLNENFEFRLNPRDDGTSPPEMALMDPVHATKVYSFNPKTFAENYLKFKPDDYVTVTANPFRPINRVYEMEESNLEVPEPGRSPENMTMLNATNARLLELTIASLKAGVPVWFGADVRQAVNYKNGVMHPDVFASDDVYGWVPESGALNLKDRILFGTTAEVHAMLITGYDQPGGDSGEIIKLRVENSWGKYHVFHMYKAWFQNYVFSVIVPKSLLNKRESSALKKKPEMVSEENWETQ